MIQVHNKSQLKKIRAKSPFMGSSTDYKINKSNEYNVLKNSFIMRGHTLQKACLMALTELNRSTKVSKITKNQEKSEKINNELISNKDVVIGYKHAEIIGKIIKGNSTHLIVQTTKKNKPLWLDRRYIKNIIEYV